MLALVKISGASANDRTAVKLDGAMRTGYLIIVVMALFVWALPHAHADSSAFTHADAKTPFDPVFSPAVGSNAEDPTMVLKQFINPDYMAATRQLMDIYAGTQPAEKNNRAGMTTPYGDIPPIHEPVPAPVIFPGTESVALTDSTVEKPEGKSGFFNILLSLFGFKNSTDRDRPDKPEYKVADAATRFLGDPAGDMYRYMGKPGERDRRPGTGQPGVKQDDVMPVAASETDGLKTGEETVQHQGTAESLTGASGGQDVSYGYTDDGISRASLSLAPVGPVPTTTEHNLLPATNRPPGTSAAAALQPAVTITRPSALKQDRDGQRPTFFDAVASFFGGSTEGTHRRMNKPGEQGQHPAAGQGGMLSGIGLETEAEDDGKLQITRTPERQQDVLLARMDADGVETPLVDEAVKKLRQWTRIDDDPGLVIDIPVPISGTPPLKEERLALGMEGVLGKPLSFSDSPDTHCVRRRQGRTWICVETLAWPSAIEDAFATTQLKRGRSDAIIRYDEEIATQYRMSFPTENFDRIAAYFEHLLGAPDERPTVMVSIFAQPKKANRIIRWVAAESEHAPPAILEMREIDDVRWSETPDTRRGVARLYRRGMKPIFSMVMASEIKLIGRKHYTSADPAFTATP